MPDIRPYVQPNAQPNVQPNIEIKAACPNVEAAHKVALGLQTEPPQLLHQVDTYFTTQTGRLKLREINGEKGQLIPYQKDYTSGPMRSDYTLLPVSDMALTKNLLIT